MEIWSNGKEEGNEPKTQAGYCIGWKMTVVGGVDKMKSDSSLIEASPRQRQTGGEQEKHNTLTEQPETY